MGKCPGSHNLVEEKLTNQTEEPYALEAATEPLSRTAALYL